LDIWDIAKYSLIPLITFIVGVIWQRKLQGSSRQSEEAMPETGGRTRTIQAGRGIFWVGYLSLLFWSVLIGLTILFPGTDDSVQLPQLIFLFFLLLSLLLIFCAHTYVSTWNREQIQGTTVFGKRVTLLWKDVSHCEYAPTLQVFFIGSKAEKQPSLIVPESWEGTTPLIRFLEKNQAHLCPPKPDEAGDDIDNYNDIGHDHDQHSDSDYHSEVRTKEIKTKEIRHQENQDSLDWGDLGPN
jgi:hypothetical protein